MLKRKKKVFILLQVEKKQKVFILLRVEKKRESVYSVTGGKEKVFMTILTLCFLKCWGMPVLKKLYAVMFCLKNKRMYQSDFSKGDVV